MRAERPRPASTMLRAAPGIITVVASAVMLSGCAGLSAAPTSVALSEGAGFPADAPITEPLFGEPLFGETPGGQLWQGEPVGWLADDRETLTIVSYGSSACPYIATAISVVDDFELSIELRQGAAESCTDDLAAHTHLLATPAGWGTGDGPYSARISRTLDAFGAVDPELSTAVLWPVPTDGGTPVTDSIAIETIRGVPDDISLPDDALNQGEPLAFWGEGRATLRVITWGSSSCPPPALSLSATATDELAIVFGVLPPVVCTADFAPTTHVLTTPEGSGSEGTGSAAATLAITIEQRNADSLNYRVVIAETR